MEFITETGAGSTIGPCTCRLSFLTVTPPVVMGKTSSHNYITQDVERDSAAITKVPNS
jgi:hypothetical protein